MDDLIFKAEDEPIAEWMYLSHACMPSHERNYHGVEHVCVRADADALLMLSVTIVFPK